MLKAKEASWQGNAEYAALIYQSFINERYPFIRPYEMLINLYQKKKDRVNERLVLRYALEFFNCLRERQKDYVLSLATAHNIVSEIHGMLATKQSIMYYNNAFTIYDPTFILVTWHKRLSFINQEK